MTIQWVHLLAVGVWIGGLAAFLAGIGRRPEHWTAVRVRQFARLATLGIVAVAVSGLLRATVEVGSLRALVDTPFGRVLDAKSVLFVVLAALAAIQHFWNVPRAGFRLDGLRKIGWLELGLGVTMIGLSAVLVDLVPPASIPVSAAGTGAAAADEAAPGEPLVFTGEDLGRSIQAVLQISPGSVGLNHFELSANDTEVEGSTPPDRVSLRFSLPADPRIGGSRLDLSQRQPSTFGADGSELSVAGIWRVVATIGWGSSAVEVPFSVPIVASGQPIDVQRFPGMPSISTVQLTGGGSLEAYSDPGTAGLNEIHIIFIDAAGDELVPVPAADIALVGLGAESQGSVTPATPRMLAPGHFVADVTLPAGRGDLPVLGLGPDGRTRSARIPIEIGP